MRGALAFLTVFGGAAPAGSRTLDWFPAVGLATGAAVGGVWWMSGEIWGGLVAAVLAVIADLAITGLLHIDGLGDTADGLVPPLPRERRLEVMASPELGAFGVAVVGVTLLLRVAVLASVTPNVLVVGAIWCSSRTLMAVVTRGGTYARPGGLAEELRGGAVLPVAVAGCVLAGAAAVIGSGADGLVALVACGVGFVAVTRLAWHRIGGFTGDVLGAAGVVGETVGLLAWAGMVA